MSHWEKYELLFKRILAIIIAILVFGNMMLSEEPDTDEDITIENKCELALRNLHDTPKNVIIQCKKLLKENNEPE